MKYSEFQPTGFDPCGLGLDNRQDWLVVPVSYTRDSGPLDESNFVTALDMLGGESATCEVHRFGHWGPGWFEIILVHPDREDAVAEIESRLEDYPLLDEEDYSQKQYDEIMEAWDNMSLQERIDFAVENGHSCFAARTDNPFDVNNDRGDAVYQLIGEY
jgi:hypothetical protein